MSEHAGGGQFSMSLAPAAELPRIAVALASHDTSGGLPFARGVRIRGVWRADGMFASARAGERMCAQKSSYDPMPWLAAGARPVGVLCAAAAEGSRVGVAVAESVNWMGELDGSEDTEELVLLS